MIISNALRSNGHYYRISDLDSAKTREATALKNIFLDDYIINLSLLLRLFLNNENNDTKNHSTP